MSLVDVIIPVRDGGNLLARAVDSVRSQNVDLTVIVVDDGSRDGAVERLPRDPRIRILKNAGRGIPAALNTATAAGTSPFVARQDADDESLPGRLAAQLEYFEDHPSTGIAGTHFEILAGTKPVAVMRPSLGDLMEQNSLCAGSIVGRRDVLQKAGGYREAFALSSDYDMWLRCAAIADVAILPIVGYRYRLTANMASIRRPSLQAEYAGLARASARALRDGTPDPVEHTQAFTADTARDAEVSAWWAHEFAALGAWRESLACLRRLPLRRAATTVRAMLPRPRPQSEWT